MAHVCAPLSQHKVVPFSFFRFSYLFIYFHFFSLYKDRRLNTFCVEEECIFCSDSKEQHS
jgi:hypothetical protein